MNDWIDNNFRIVFLAALLWNILWIGGLTIWSIRRRQPINGRTTIFEEKWASGSSDRNYYTRVGGAGRSLEVKITELELIIRPFFLFRFMGPLVDLDHVIPFEKITKIHPELPPQKQGTFSRVTTRLSELIGRKKLLWVEFETPKGQTRFLTLLLKKREDLLEKLHEKGVSVQGRP